MGFRAQLCFFIAGIELRLRKRNLWKNERTCSLCCFSPLRFRALTIFHLQKSLSKVEMGFRRIGLTLYGLLELHHRFRAVALCQKNPAFDDEGFGITTVSLKNVVSDP